MKRQPYIGITCDTFLPDGRQDRYELVCDHRYVRSVKDAGGFPILLPIGKRPKILRESLDVIDGLIIVGGDDVDPKLYGERRRPGTGTVFGPRQYFEQQLYWAARKERLPILGICYGMQFINVLEGGRLYQDIRRDAGLPRDHHDLKSPLHRVRVDPTSRLGAIIRKRQITVHCQHHQAVRRVARGFRAVAHSADGVVEAIEGRREEVLAVQWHPERMFRSPSSKRIFRHFVNLCRP